MAKKELTLLQSASSRMRISRMGALTVLVVDGQGMALTLTADFSPIEKWAQSKPAGPNGMIDRSKILDKIDVMIVRPGTTFGSTRGSIKPMEALVRAMKANGFDTKEFQLPPELKDGYVSPEEAAKEKAKEKAKQEAKENADGGFPHEAKEEAEQPAAERPAGPIDFRRTP